MAIDFNRGSVICSQETICLNQDMQKYSIEDVCDNVLHKKISSGFFANLKNRFSFCSSEYSKECTGFDQPPSPTMCSAICSSWLCCSFRKTSSSACKKRSKEVASMGRCSNDYSPSPRCSYQRPEDTGQELSDELSHSETQEYWQQSSANEMKSTATKVILDETGKGETVTRTLPVYAEYGHASAPFDSIPTADSEKFPPSEGGLSRPSSSSNNFDDDIYEPYESPLEPLPGATMLTVPPVYDHVKEALPGWSLSKELEKLSKHGWYWGPITRLEAEEKLANRLDGTFLVRDSSDDRYLLSLSFRSYGHTLHTRIEHCNGIFSLYTQTESEGYNSIVDLIEHSVNDSQTGVFCYSRARTPGSLSFPVRLTRPVSRFAQVRTLQYLCRFLIRQFTRVDLIQSLPLPNAIKDFLEERPY